MWSLDSGEWMELIRPHHDICLNLAKFKKPQAAAALPTRVAPPHAISGTL